MPYLVLGVGSASELTLTLGLSLALGLRPETEPDLEDLALRVGSWRSYSEGKDIPSSSYAASS